MNRGYLVVAENNNDIDFIRMAYGLALSIKHSQSKYKKLSIITTDKVTNQKYIDIFDKIIVCEKDEDWKEKSKSLDTTSLCASYYDLTPYDETIVLDTDMIFPTDISHWWKLFSDEDLLFTFNVKTFREKHIFDNYYRKVFIENNLPNIYTGLFYFKKSTTAKNFFKLVNLIFDNWKLFFENLKEKYRPNFLSADLAYSIAYKTMELPDYSYLPIPTFTHMKTQLQDIGNTKEEWTNFLNVFINDKIEIKINNYLQRYPLHYHDKKFLTEELIKSYENFT